MADTLPADFHLHLVAGQVVSTCRLLGESPTALGFHLIQDDPLHWHVAMEMDYPYPSWPSGIGGLMTWDTTRYPDVDTAFQAALAQAMAKEA